MNAVVLKAIIKTTGQKLGSALSGTLKVHVQTRSFSSIIEKRGKLSAFVMSRMVTSSGTKRADVTGFTHR